MTCADWPSVLGPFVGLCCNVVVQTAAARLSADGGLLRSVFLGFVAGLGAALAWEVAQLGTGPVNGGWTVASTVAADIALYGAVAYCAFHVVNLGETARRIRIMREIRSAGEGLTTAGVLARYDAREIVARRLARLVSTGQVEKIGDAYVARKSTLGAIAGVMFLLKRAFPS